MSDDSTPDESGPTADVVPIVEAKKRRSGRSSAAPYVVPSLPATLTLSESHIEHLSSSGIDRAELDDAQVYSATDRRDIAQLLGRSNALPGGTAIVFPFVEPDADAPYGYRLRPDHPRRGSDQHVVKYDQCSRAQGVGTLVYFPPKARTRHAYSSIVEPLYTTEGEKKALVLDQLGYCALGLTGVWNWLDGDRDKRTGDALHPLIVKHVTLVGRRCVIVFDQDARSNQQVMRAARRLAGAYYAAGAAEVLFTCPPEHQPSKGLDDYFAANGGDALRAMLDTAEPLSPIDPGESRDRALTDFPWCEGAPLPAEYAVPRGYAIDAGSGLVTCLSGDRTVEVSTSPIFIGRRFVDADSGEHHADVVFRHAGKWTTVHVPRRALGDARAMTTELVQLGAPMHGGHSRHLLPWFAKLELANEARLAVVQTTERTGWRGVTGFMTGELLGSTTSSALLPGRELRRVGKALTARGDLEAHVQALRVAWSASPYARLALCAALAAPLLMPLDERGFALHLFGDTNTGKSTILRVAASVYGDPSEGAGWVGTWNISPAAAESRASQLCDLPQFYDEAGLATADQVQRLVYMLINGEGRGRAMRDGTARGTTTWRTIVLSTGEITLAQDDMAAGAQARVIDVCVPGLGGLQGKHIEIASLLRACRLNAGCLGRDWIERLCTAPPVLFDQLGGQLYALRSSYAASNNASARQLHYLALLEVAESLAIQNYGFESSGRCVAEVFASDDRRETESASIAMADIVEDWIKSREAAFPYAERLIHGPYQLRSSATPSTQRLGVRVFSLSGELVEVLINKTELKRLCREHGQSYQQVVRTWANEGRILVDHSGPSRRFEVQRSEAGGGRSRWVAWLPSRHDEGGEK